MREEPSVILVVEDDPDLREAAVTILGDRGHHVLAAANGDEALREVRRTGRIDLLFTDIVMPGIDGFTLARRVKEERPEIKVLYTTGHADRVAAELGSLFGKVLPKPYGVRALQEEVEIVLELIPTEHAGYWRDKAQQFREAARRQGGSDAAVLEKRAAEFEAMAAKMND